ELSTFYVMDVTFEKINALKGFINALQRKPIAYSYSWYQTNSHPSATLAGIIPHKELSNFMNCLESLQDYGIVKAFTCHVLDLEKSKGRALPYHCYDEELGWLYSMDYCIEEILKLVKASHVGKARFAKAAERAIESK
ncbi:MAG: hypothetical protein ACXQTI_07680, partial [Candidatus Nezhaarchaeales archaeon]